ncbi:YhhA family cyclophane-containing RiPP [Hahella aquimaris]|uniref:YhhA family cyclophane-containing RiPP n=1 Tax=Hahella sp. HNIBRBA332 TaxID=3015983 RepID=UPI00352F0DEC
MSKENENHGAEASVRNPVRDALLRNTSSNLALQRLQSRVLKTTNASEVITSYDRMHHRHNRS